jgi:hypothetical protein
MRTALDAHDDALDDQERAFVASVREHGWFRTGVFAEDDNPGFSYTTGFCVNARRPEFLIFSMKDAIAHDIFWELFRDAKMGVSLPVGEPLDNVFGNGPAFAFPIAKKFYREHLGWSNWFYGLTAINCFLGKRALMRGLLAYSPTSVKMAGKPRSLSDTAIRERRVSTTFRRTRSDIRSAERDAGIAHLRTFRSGLIKHYVCRSPPS